MSDIEPYVKVSRQVAQDTRLSFEARGVMLYLLSKPAGWKILPADLRREGGIGRDKAYNILTELEQAGYLKPRAQVRKPDGTFGWSDYELQPYTENTDVATPHKEAKQPRTPSPLPAQPYTAQPYTVNTDVLDIKEEQIKEKEKIRAPRKSAAAPPSKKEPKDSTPLAVIQAMADVCKIDRDVITKEKHIILAQAAGALYQNGTRQGKTEDDIISAIRWFGEWFKTFWKGKNNAAPTTSDVRDYWKQAMDARNNSSALVPPTVAASRQPQVQTQQPSRRAILAERAKMHGK
jgi:hypothetical protein